MNKDVSPDQPLSLAADFAPASDAAWRKLVDKVLAGADFDKKLVAHSYDGLAIKPLYTRADWNADGDPSGMPGAAPFTRGGTLTGALGGWDVRQLHANAEPSKANANILEDLACGVTSITLKVDPTGATGTAVRTLADLDTALKDVFLDAAPVALDASGATLGPAALLMQLLVQRGMAEAFTGNFGLDELGALAATGSMPEPMLAALADAAAFAGTSFPKARAINVRGTIYHNAGASEAQELGAALATAVAYLRALTAAGLDVDAACGQLAFTLAADADFFL
ncbi:MAG: methylmalonyl-CoA mutase family protein, partial [Croceibacterium sp.]